MNEIDYFWGVDCGSTEIKVVVCNAKGQIIHRAKGRTLFPLKDHVQNVIRANPNLSPFENTGTTIKNGHKISATGYGRAHLDFAQGRLTEIKAHGLGVQQTLGLSETFSIIDIGGQDSKVTVVSSGNVDKFSINRKCAAGTGAYIEELAHRLRLDLSDLPELERKHDKDLLLNSYCTVFASQEVIKILMEGERIENLIHALYQSVVKRVLEMTGLTTETVVFSGGVLQYHPPLREMFQRKFPEKKFILAPEAQYAGAYGAALFGIGGES